MLFEANELSRLREELKEGYRRSLAGKIDIETDKKLEITAEGLQEQNGDFILSPIIFQLMADFNLTVERALKTLEEVKDMIMLRTRLSGGCEFNNDGIGDGFLKAKFEWVPKEEKQDDKTA